jgi:hypothetical protein
MAVGGAAELRGRTREQFCAGRYLRMHFHADDNLPIAGCAFHKPGRFGRNGHLILSIFSAVLDGHSIS